MTTLAEPEWDTETRELALALDQVDLCSVCGGPRWMCQDPETAFDWEAEAHRCHRRTAMAEAASKLTEQSNPHLEALEWLTTRRSATRPSTGTTTG